MAEILLSASPHWWVTGWVLSIAMLLVGFGIAYVYYDVDEDDETAEGTGVDAA